MSVSFNTVRFWLCPECKRHVPARKDACICGFDRTTAAVQIPEAPIHAPQSRLQERSAFATLWPFAVIAVLVGWIAHDRLQSEPADALENASPPVAVSPVATTNPVSVEVVEARHDGTDTRSPQHSSPPATPQPPVLRIEVPRQESAPASRVSGEDEDERRRREEEAARREQELEWRTRASRLIGLLRTALAGYRSQVCSEARGGIAVSTTRDNQGAYVSARAEAQALEESARVAGVPPDWVRISWSEFPEPEDTASGGYNPAAVAARWNCGNVTGWGH
jgi:hypothetical protein